MTREEKLMGILEFAKKRYGNHRDYAAKIYSDEDKQIYTDGDICCILKNKFDLSSLDTCNITNDINYCDISSIVKRTYRYKCFYECKIGDLKIGPKIRVEKYLNKMNLVSIHFDNQIAFVNHSDLNRLKFFLNLHKNSSIKIAYSDFCAGDDYTVNSLLNPIQICNLDNGDKGYIMTYHVYYRELEVLSNAK